MYKLLQIKSNLQGDSIENKNKDIITLSQNSNNYDSKKLIETK